MLTRTSTTRLTFRHGFVLPGYTDPLPAGDYDIVVEEELMESLSFQAYRRTGTFLILRGTGPRIGQTEMRPTTEGDLDRLQRSDLSQQTAPNQTAPNQPSPNKTGEAALSPLENSK